MEPTYKKTVAGSVGAGFGAIFNASSKNYYILEHKTDSLYHKVGESQKIIVDEIELGRDANCQVRFDEACETVSRHHAAIVKDDQGWKLISLSKTNVTLVNGQIVNGEWHLNSGDEIQLSSKGPVIGFIAPQGPQGTAQSIGLSERLSLFREQALRPYKIAIIIIVVLLLAAIGLGVYATVKGEKSVLVEKAPVQVAPVEAYENSVYYIKMDNISLYDPNNKLVLSFATEKIVGGTGCLLNDGRFVTARRVVEPWYYRSADSTEEIGRLDNESWCFRDFQFFKSCGYSIVANFTAYSKSGSNFQFKNTDMYTFDWKNDNNSEYLITENYQTKMSKKKYSLKTKSGLLYFLDQMLDMDYAIMAKKDQLPLNGGAQFNNAIADKLDASKEVNILGFPSKVGFVNSSDIKPLKAINNVNVTGFNNNGVIELSSKKYQKGNDGAPVFTVDGDKWVVIGILSHSDEFDRDIVVPISCVK